MRPFFCFQRGSGGAGLSLDPVSSSDLCTRPWSAQGASWRVTLAGVWDVEWGVTGNGCALGVSDWVGWVLRARWAPRGGSLALGWEGSWGQASGALGAD